VSAYPEQFGVKWFANLISAIGDFFDIAGHSHFEAGDIAGDSDDAGADILRPRPPPAMAAARYRIYALSWRA
jgi:hypothetical protein